MSARPPFHDLLRAVEQSLDLVKPEQANHFLEIFVIAYREKRVVGVVGAGRSGLVAKSFAMRLMHLGFNVFVIGETITPAIKDGDILLAVSGSGDTELTVSSAQVAKRVGAKVVSITSFLNSNLAKLSDVVLIVPGRVQRTRTVDYFSRQLLGIHEPLAPLGTVFELSVSFLLDSMVTELMRLLNVKESDMLNRHSTVP